SHKNQGNRHSRACRDESVGRFGLPAAPGWMCVTCDRKSSLSRAVNCCFQIRQVRRLSGPCIQRYSLFCSGECSTYVTPAFADPSTPPPFICPHSPHRPPALTHSPRSFQGKPAWRRRRC
ncbi:unnamed protein product, partial [Tetraodon nigroviridis]